jgi:hypothetical protein
MMRTLATFQSDAFNQTEPREYFINPGCYGDDACRWLMGRLRAAGLTVDAEPGQEDFGWYFCFTVPEGEHCCVVGLRPADNGEPATWISWVERQRGFLGSLLGGRNRGIAMGATAALHAAFAAPEIRNLRWHEKTEFDAGSESGSPHP